MSRAETGKTHSSRALRVLPGVTDVRVLGSEGNSDRSGIGPCESIDNWEVGAQIRSDCMVIKVATIFSVGLKKIGADG